MNSSSAFSNVLLSSPAQPASNIPSVRGPSDQDDKPGFKRALDDARAQREVEPQKPVGKKVAAQDRAAKANAKTPADAPATPALTTETTKAAVKNAKPAEKSGEEKLSEEKIAAEDIIAVEPPEPINALAVLGLQAPVEPSATLAVTDPVILDEVILPTESSLLVNEDSPLVFSPDETPVAIEVEAQLPEAVVTGDAEEIISGAAATPDPALVVAANSAATAVIPEAVAAAGLAPLKGLEVKSDKLATVADPSAASADSGAAVADESLLASDDQSALDNPKLVFEKMLQAIAGNATANKSGSGDQQKAPDLAASLAVLTPESSAPAVAVDSLPRSLEAQLPSARNFLVQTGIPVSVGQPSWSQAVGEKVLWLAAQNVQAAEIILDPPELGPMQVKVSVHQEQTSISFTSHNAGVRELLDQSLGRLRDMFNEQGLNLVNVDVSDKSFQRHQGEGGEQQGQGSRNSEEEEESVQAVSAIVQQRLVDHYA